jgi:DNA-binding MarR family transcriptional regulator
MSESLAMLFRRASQGVEKQASRHVRPLKLTYRQLVVLLTVADQPGLMQREVTDRTGIDRTTINNIVSALIERGLMERKDDEADERVWRLHTTKKAKAKIDQGKLAMERIDGHLRGLINPKAPLDRNLKVVAGFDLEKAS